MSRFFGHVCAAKHAHNREWRCCREVTVGVMTAMVSDCEVCAAVDKGGGAGGDASGAGWSAEAVVAADEEGSGSGDAFGAGCCSSRRSKASSTASTNAACGFGSTGAMAGGFGTTGATAGLCASATSGVWSALLDDLYDARRVVGQSHRHRLRRHMEPRAVPRGRSHSHTWNVLHWASQNTDPLNHTLQRFCTKVVAHLTRPACSV